MKKIWICFLCVVLISSVGLCSAQETTGLEKYDGKFWSELEKLDKVYFLEGYLMGVKAVYYEEKWFKEAYEDPDYADAADKKKAEVIQEVLDDIKSTFNIFGLTYGKLVDGLDAVYKSEENRVIPIYRVLTPVAENLRGEINDSLLQDYIADLRDEYTK
jgi:hypothetical protein